MPSTVYRGDLAEISFGHESGVYLKHDYTGSFRFHALAKYSENTSTLYFAGGAANTPCASGVLKYPQGMLVGSQLIFSDLSGTNNLSNSTFDELNNASNPYIETSKKNLKLQLLILQWLLLQMQMLLLKEYLRTNF